MSRVTLVLLVVLAALFVASHARIRRPRQFDGDDLPLIWTLTEGQRGVGSGFDIVDDLRNPPPLFEFTYDRGMKYIVLQNPFLVPDGVALDKMGRYKGERTENFINTWEDYFKFKETSTSIKASVKYEQVELDLAFSKTKGQINKLTNNGSKSFTYTGGTYMTFALEFRGLQRPPLDEYFKYDIDHLPATYSAEHYGRFVKYWGTHYFTRAVYGCEYNITATIDKKFTESDKKAWTKSQLDLTLKVNMFEFGVTKEKTANKTDIDGGIASATNVIANALGGDELLFVMEKDFDSWLDSCHTIKMPLVRYSTIEPITNLITDANKRNNLKKAIITYGTTGRF